MDREKRNFRAVKAYHRLEKSLSFRVRRPGAGKQVVQELAQAIDKTKTAGLPLTFHEQIAVNVIDRFGKLEGCSTSVHAPSPVTGGVLRLTASGESGRLADPDAFFKSRHSVRDFESTSIEPNVIRRAVELAQRSPSVCNRQSWHVYHLATREKINAVLSHQNGNSGFGHEVPTLLVVAADLRAFDSAEERYQHWIDGGMFSMTLIWALHSLGVSTCALNWSKGPLADISFRRTFPLEPSHSVIMMIAAGIANNSISVCSSPRPTVDEILTKLD